MRQMCNIIGCEIKVGELVYEPPRDGPTLWEIGIPDRTAAEFYVPDPNPLYINRLYINHSDRYKSDRTSWFNCWFDSRLGKIYEPIYITCRYRQYGLWERYADLYPNEDLVYNVGISDYKKDWFFAQVTRFVFCLHLNSAS
jgi:rhamnogalacturonan endolyase